MAVPVDESTPDRETSKPEIESAGNLFASEKFFERQCQFCKRIGFFARQQQLELR